MSSENLINFDELEHIRQSNNRDSQYELKRVEENKFIISQKGKSIIGHTAEMGIDLRAGNGVVLVAVRPKDDKRCTRGLLNGAIGKTFTSSKLEAKMQENGLIAEDTAFYSFEFKQEWQDGKYYAIAASDDQDDDEEAVMPQPEENIEQEAAPEEVADAAPENETVTTDEEF